MGEGTASAIQEDAHTVRGILLDLDGVVYVGRTVVPGSLEAISQIRAAQLPLKFITNTTRRSLRRIVSNLAQLRLQVEMEDVYTPAAIAQEFLRCRNLRPFLVVHPNLREDFSGLTTEGDEAVVVGDAGEFLAYDLFVNGGQDPRKVGGARFFGMTFADGLAAPCRRPLGGNQRPGGKRCQRRKPPEAGAEGPR